jgi:ferredoxin
VADRDDKVPENVPGAFYVDHTCIDCELCRETAPGSFTRQDRQGYSFVFRQPRDEAERDACQAALEECPVEAIGRDGQGDTA